MVKALTGEGGGAVRVQGDTVSVNLAPFIQTVKARLVDAGFSLLDTLGTWPPILTLALLAVLAMIEFLGRPARQPAAALSAPPPPGPR